MEFWKKLWALVKKKWWYALLVCGSSYYVWKNHEHIGNLTELNAQNIVFVFWMVLLLLPLFSEMEFLGVKVKKEVEEEVEKATSDIKNNLQQLQTQMNYLQLSNSNANTINFGNYPLPSLDKLDELYKKIEELVQKHPNARADSWDSVPKEDANTYLFKIRLNIETTLRNISEKMGYEERFSIMRMANRLYQAELLDKDTCDLMMKVIQIANRGVHGEIISDEYISFVKNSYPVINQELQLAYRNLVSSNFENIHN